MPRGENDGSAAKLKPSSPEKTRDVVLDKRYVEMEDKYGYTRFVFHYQEPRFILEELLTQQEIAEVLSGEISQERHGVLFQKALRAFKKVYEKEVRAFQENLLLAVRIAETSDRVKTKPKFALDERGRIVDLLDCVDFVPDEHNMSMGTGLLGYDEEWLTQNVSNQTSLPNFFERRYANPHGFAHGIVPFGSFEAYKRLAESRYGAGCLFVDNFWFEKTGKEITDVGRIPPRGYNPKGSFSVENRAGTVDWGKKYEEFFFHCLYHDWKPLTTITMSGHGPHKGKEYDRLYKFRLDALYEMRSVRREQIRDLFEKWSRESMIDASRMNCVLVDLPQNNLDLVYGNERVMLIDGLFYTCKIFGGDCVGQEDITPTRQIIGFDINGSIGDLLDQFDHETLPYLREEELERQRVDFLCDRIEAVVGR